MERVRFPNDDHIHDFMLNSHLMGMSYNWRDLVAESELGTLIQLRFELTFESADDSAAEMLYLARIRANTGRIHVLWPERFFSEGWTLDGAKRIF